MAGGKLKTEDDKSDVLNFIAMLALNMSKEVLSAFGILNKKLLNQTQ
jgi:hypothetical protein